MGSSGASPSSADTLPVLGRRNTLWVLASLAAIVLLAWAYLIRLAMPESSQMTGMPDMAHARMAETVTVPYGWGWYDAALTFAMWSVMMVAMMLPGAAPVALLVARINARTPARIAVFVLGYLAIWTMFSAAATGAQGGLQTLRLMAESRVTDQVLGALLLIAAGLYQWSPLKERCLAHCQSPLGFLMSHWRPGWSGALRLGFAHGAYCLGCCGALMLLLFVGGVMNLLWVAGLAALVLLEKVLPAGPWLARGAGLLLVAWGTVRLVAQGG